MSVFQNNPPQIPSPPLSFGIEKHLISTLSSEEQVTEEHFALTVKSAFCLAYPEKTITPLLPTLVTKVVQRIDSLQKPEQKPKHFHVNKSLGTNYAAWLSELNAEQVCLYLADYDPNKAAHYYWFADIHTVQEAVKLKSQHDNQLALIQMEACLYGAGGKYQEDTGGDGGNNYDMDSSESASALQTLGF